MPLIVDILLWILAYIFISFVSARISWVLLKDYGWMGHPKGVDPDPDDATMVFSALFWPLFWPIVALWYALVVPGIAFVTRPTRGDRRRERAAALAQRAREEKLEELRLAKIAVEAGLADELPEHLRLLEFDEQHRQRAISYRYGWPE